MSARSEQDAAHRLWSAADTGVPCAPVTDLIGPDDIAAAYRVQGLVLRRRITGGATRVGRKIGLTAEAVQRQIGVDQPDFGVLLDDMAYTDGDTVPMDRLLQPKAEAEIAFRLGRDLDGNITPTSVRAAVHSAVAALEIVDSRVADWNIGITDTVADNASSGVFVLGTGPGLTLDAFEPVAVEMELTRNGVPASRGTGRDCLGDPLHALDWLARTALEFGAPLRAGDIVLSGALGPMVTVEPGDSFTTTIGPLGSIGVHFTREDQNR